MANDDLKRAAAERAVEEHVESGMVVGLGTGSTAAFAVRKIGELLAQGTLNNVRGVPTSARTAALAREVGIPVVTLAEARPVLTIDGADEIAPDLSLIKGLGGALLREKIVAQNSRSLVIIADAGKSVPKLGTKAMLPVEVVPFAHEVQEAFLRSLGATPALRRAGDAPFQTDNGNYIYDCRFDGIDDPRKLDVALRGRAGVVETGLFIGMASVALVGDEERVEVRKRR